MAGIAGVLAGEGVDYVSLAIGDSSTYLGSVGIVPPPPVAENVIAEHAEPFAGALPRITTSRIVDPVEANRLLAEGRAEAVGMTRALITDPDLPAKARSGRLAELVRCVGCNACIAHYHAGTPIACAVNPRTGRELHLPRAVGTAPARRLVVVGGGPAGLAAAVEAGHAGREVVLLERTDRLGGQIALAGARPAGSKLAAVFLDNAARQLTLAGVELRLGAQGRGSVLALEPDAVIVATGARPYRDDALAFDGSSRPARGRCSKGGCRSETASWSPTGAATRAASTPPRYSRAQASGSLSPSPRSRRASSSTSTGATSTCSGSTAPA